MNTVLSSLLLFHTILILFLVRSASAEATVIQSSDHHTKLVHQSGKNGIIYYATIEFDFHKSLSNELHLKFAVHDPHVYVGVTDCTDTAVSRHVCNEDVSGAIVAYRKGMIMDIYDSRSKIMDLENVSSWVESLNLSVKCTIHDIEGTCSAFAAQFINSKWGKVKNKDVLLKEIDRLDDMMKSDRVQSLPKHKQALFLERIDILTQLSIAVENEDEF